MQREAAVACSACCRSSWRTRRGRAHIEPHTNQSSSACPSPSAASAPDAAGVILTPLVRKFMPWLEELRSQLRAVTVDIVRVTRHFDIDAESAVDTDDDDEAVGDERSPSETFAESQRLGARLGSLVTLLHEQLLPRLPHDPEALFLVAAAEFARQDIEGALRHMQRSLLPEQRATRAELSRRHYFVAVLCIRLLDPRATDTRVQEAARARIAVASAARRETLLDLMERSLLESIRLDGFVSAYIDIEYLASLRHGTDLEAAARCAKALGDAAAALDGRYWPHGLQRPSHLLRPLRSHPFYDPAEFAWASMLLQAYAEIKAEVEALRAPPRGAEPGAWDAVGSKHDAGDRDLAAGDWKEAVLINADTKLAREVARIRRRCPATCRVLDGWEAAAHVGACGIGECTFSALGPKAHLRPHCGSTNARLTCHLPLIVPEGEHCAIRVGDEMRTYREGELLVFDDSWEHEVWNRHPTQCRVVLLVRFWHPDIPPAKYAATKQRLKRMLTRHRRATLMPPLL